MEEKQGGASLIEMAIEEEVESEVESEVGMMGSDAERA